MKLKEKIGRIEIKSKGIVLTKDSTQEQLERAIKSEPNLEKYILKNAKNDKEKK